MAVMHNCEVLLLYPKADQEKDFIPPFSLLSCAGPLLKQGYSVKLLDQRLEKDFFKIVDNIIKTKLLCFGITFMTGSQIKYAVEIMKYVKKNYPEIPIVAGGCHATILPEQTINNEYIDYVILGEGEETFLELIEAFKYKTSPQDIAGLVYKHRGEIKINNRQRPAVDLNKYSEIPWEVIADYLPCYRKDFLLTSRGCTDKCHYCISPVLSPQLRLLSSENVIRQIKQIIKFYENAKAQLMMLSFVDDNLFADLQRLKEIANFITNEKKPIYWWAETRVDFILKIADEDLAELKKSGLFQLYIGAESGSPRILKLINKKITPEMILEANRKLKRHNIEAEYTFMAGFPGETEKEFEETKLLIAKIIEEYPQAKIWKLNSYTPYPGTSLYNLAVQAGFNPPHNLEGWAEIDWYRKEYSIKHDKQLN